MKRSKTIVFLLPRTGEHPIGGFKVVYEYANRLANDGYRVKICYGIATRPVKNIFINILYHIVRFGRYLKYLLYKEFRPTSWFRLDAKIEQKLMFSTSLKPLECADIVIATSWVTAFWADRLKSIDPKNKFYLIQHFENWHGKTDEIEESWRMDLHKIVIAPWLEKIACDLGEKSTLIHNGIEQKEFYITTPIEKKNKNRATMLWHDHPFKACDVGLTALKIVKKKEHGFKAVLFGVPPKPNNLPAWIEYYQVPEKSWLRDVVYNNSAIFVGPSSQEGWALTVPESMMCGCAVACTDIDGYAPSAVKNKTALTSPVGDAEALANNIIKLINDDNLRFDLANNGNEHVKQFTWERAYSRFRNQIENPDIWL